MNAMNEIIYLESSEEITSVIDRLKANPSSLITFVIPRGASLAQSIVNLKLLKKSAEEVGKEISLVANDRISRNLASQIGITVYSKVSEAQRAKPVVKAEEKIADKGEMEAGGPFKVNNYYHNKEEDELHGSESQMNTDSAPDDDTVEQETTEEEPLGENQARKNHVPAHEAGITRRPLSEKRADHYQNDNSNHPEKVMPTKENRENRKPANLRGSRKPLIIIFASLLMVLIALSYVFLPYASAKIVVKTQDFSSEKEITIDKNSTAIDNTKLIMPGKMLELEKDLTKTFDATGKKDVGTKASGTLSFSNNSGIDDQIAAGATIKSSGGIEFTIDQAVSVPKATATVGSGGQIQLNPGKASGKVTAKSSGDNANLPATTLYSVGGKPLITATGPTAGGISKQINVVTEGDLTKAENDIKTELSSSVKTDLEGLATKDKLSVFDDSSKSESISSDSTKKADEEADKFDYSVKMKFYIIGFSRSDLDQTMVNASEKDLDSGKMIINPAKAGIDYKVLENNTDTGTMKLKANLTGKSSQKMDENSIKSQIKGKSAAKAEEMLKSNADVLEVNTDVWPKFLGRTPLLQKRIKISFDYND